MLRGMCTPPGRSVRTAAGCGGCVAPHGVSLGAQRCPPTRRCVGRTALLHCHRASFGVARSPGPTAPPPPHRTTEGVSADLRGGASGVEGMWEGGAVPPGRRQTLPWASPNAILGPSQSVLGEGGVQRPRPAHAALVPRMTCSVRCFGKAPDTPARPPPGGRSMGWQRGRGGGLAGGQARGAGPNARPRGRAAPPPLPLSLPLPWHGPPLRRGGGARCALEAPVAPPPLRMAEATAAGTTTTDPPPLPSSQVRPPRQRRRPRPVMPHCTPPAPRPVPLPLPPFSTSRHATG